MNSIFWASYIMLWLLVGTLSIGVWALYHHFGQMYLSTPESRANQGPTEGSPLRTLEAETIDGTPLVLPIDSASLLIFVSTDCGVCKAIREGIPRAVEAYPELAVFVICKGHPRMVGAWSSGLESLVPVVADRQGRIGTRYSVDLVPFCVAVGNDGIVRARGLVNSYDSLERAAVEALSKTQSDIDILHAPPS